MRKEQYVLRIRGKRLWYMEKIESILVQLEYKVYESEVYWEVSKDQVLRDMVCCIKGYGIYFKGDGDVLLVFEQGGVLSVLIVLKIRFYYIVKNGLRGLRLKVGRLERSFV